MDTPACAGKVAGKVLFVEDDESFLFVMSRELGRLGFDVRKARDPQTALSAAAREDFDVVLLDLHLGAHDGHEVLHKLRETDVQAEIIVLTGHGTIESAVRAVRDGARDYLTKPCKLQDLETRLSAAVDARRLREENQRFRDYLSSSTPKPPIATRDPGMKALLDLLPRVAASDAPVLVQGESGTGKELIAREIHALGPVAGRPFLALNCAVLKSEILESELFGHEKGAFTGAVQRKPGLFEVASGGTLFLDEIGEVEETIQAKLLRVLQFGEIRRVGGTVNLHVRVRVVAASNRDLEGEVARGRFREDLFFRLNVVTLKLPPLRERPGDIGLLFESFLAMYGGKRPRAATRGALDALERYSWPGNVRELENVARRILIFHDMDTIDETTVRAVLPQVNARENPALRSLEDVERCHILRVLLERGNDKVQAARVLGISLKTLYNKLHVYGEI